MSTHYTSPEEQAAHEARVRAAFAASDPSRDGEIPPPVVPITGAAAAQTVRRCVCGHAITAHNDGAEKCFRVGCDCRAFSLATPPAAARTEPAGEEVSLARLLEEIAGATATRPWDIYDPGENDIDTLRDNFVALIADAGEHLRAQAERVAALEQELRAAARVFRDYGDLRTQKNTPEGDAKAIANYEHAERFFAAARRAPAGSRAATEPETAGGEG